MATFLSLLLHLLCFTFSSPLRRRSSSTSPKTPFFSFLKRLFSSTTPPPPPSLSYSHSSSTRSLHLTPAPISSGTADIHPCSICGEILPSPPLLDHHRSIHHPISELADDENIVRIIFKTGWPESAKSPTIRRILKIHSSSKIISRFEDYRERVKSRAAARQKYPADERCIADGNELLRFHCTTFVCELDPGVCGRQYCSLCGIIRSGFSPKMDGISTMPTSHAAHVSLPEGIEDEFEFMNVKRAVLVCRVVAGRVGCDPCEVDKEDPGFDSLAGRGEEEDEDELLVFNPRAVLPCFVIVYTM
ncbi:zinc finger family protein [Perilla frutescens var. frutescens]|nr:zinc finger family protein [Perilla frutescens var. frutescens]